MATEEPDDPYKVPKSAQATTRKKRRSPRLKHLLAVCLAAVLTVVLLSVTGLGDAMMAAIDSLIGR